MKQDEVRDYSCQVTRARTRLFVTMDVTRFEMPMSTEHTSRKPRPLLLRFTPPIIWLSTGKVETLVVLTTGPSPPFLGWKRPSSPVNSMLFVALKIKVIRFSVRTSRALGCMNPLVATRLVMARFSMTATRPVSIPRVALSSIPSILYLCNRPLNTKKFISVISVGVITFVTTAIMTGNRTPASREISFPLQDT